MCITVIAAGTAASGSEDGDCDECSDDDDKDDYGDCGGCGDNAVAASGGAGDGTALAAAEAAWEREAAAAWQQYEATGDISDSSASDADAGDTDWQGAACSRSDGSDAGVVSEGDDGVLEKQRGDRGSKPAGRVMLATDGAASAAQLPPLPAASAVATAAAAAGATSASPEKEEAALAKLRHAVERAGGCLPDGWRARLVGQLPGGGWKQRLFISPSNNVHRTLVSVKRTLGLAAALPAGVTSCGPVS